MHKKKIQGKNSQFKREPKDGSCWVTKQKRALVHSALRCVMICFWRMVFMLSGEAFLEQWLMWCPKCHGFHVTHKLFSASCQSTSRREEKLKKGGIKVFSRTCASVCCWFLSTETSRTRACAHMHMHAIQTDVDSSIYANRETHTC